MTKTLLKVRGNDELLFRQAVYEEGLGVDVRKDIQTSP
jgi:hypothetical protein